MAKMITKERNAKCPFHSHLHASNAHSVMLQPVHSVQYGKTLETILLHLAILSHLNRFCRTYFITIYNEVNMQNYSTSL